MFSLQTTIALAYTFYALVLLLHVLIILGVIPHTLVSGGRITSFEDQVKVSTSSIFISIIGLIFVSLGLLSPNIRKTLVYSILAFVLTAFWTLSLFLQIFGTNFERYGLSILVLLGILSHLSLALIRFGEMNE
jgi:hypothetical protein